MIDAAYIRVTAQVSSVKHKIFKSSRQAVARRMGRILQAPWRSVCSEPSATAADDMKTVFGEDAADLAAQFLVWALAETERCACPFKG